MKRSKCSLTVRIEIDLVNYENCDACRRSISVDNVDVPDCIRRIVLYCTDSKLVIDVYCEVAQSKDILTLWSTIDDIVRCVKSVLSTLKKIEEKNI